MSLRHQTTTSGDGDGEVSSQHGGGSRPCYQCHNYDAAANEYFGAIAFGTNHRDGSIQLNTENTFSDQGALVQCDGCHTTNYGTADEEHSFQDTMSGSGGLDRWGRSLELGPAGDCASCHASNITNFHSDGTVESATTHSLHVGSGYFTDCTDCHLNNGPGGSGHNTGTVNFGGTYMTSAADYLKG
jgi:hypothetical protein